MKRCATTLLALCVLPALASAADVEGFLATYEEAKKAAEARNKPMYLHFTTTWCGWCRKIEKDIYGAEEGKAALKDFVPASLDCTVPQGEQPGGEAKVNIELMKKYGGGGYPFLVIVTADGVLLNSFAGYRPMPEFKKELAKALATNKEYAEVEAAAKTSAENYEFNVKAMKTYAQVGQTNKAVAAAEKVRKLDPENAKGDGAEAALVLLDAAHKAKDDAAVKAQVEAIRQLDSKNQKQALEKALFILAMDSLSKAQQTRQSDPEASKKHLREATERFQEVAALPNLAQGQVTWAYLGQGYMLLGEKAKSVEAFEKALSLDPKSPIAPRLKQLIDRLKQPQ